MQQSSRLSVAEHKKPSRIPTVRTAFFGHSLRPSGLFISTICLIFDVVFFSVAMYLIFTIDEMLESPISEMLLQHIEINCAAFVLWTLGDSLIIFATVKRRGRLLCQVAMLPLVRLALTLVLLLVASPMLVDERMGDQAFVAAAVIACVDLAIYLDLQVYYALITYSLGDHYKVKHVSFQQ